MQTHKLIIAAASAAAFLLLLTKGDSMTQTRGIRNNNPGNIRGNNAYQWRGEVGRDDLDFVIFDTPENGLRALYKVLGTYRNKYDGIHGVGLKGFDTVEEIINRWAPPSENNTDAYIEHVASALSVDKRQALPLFKYKPLMMLIVKHENGVQPYSEAQYDEAIKRA